MKDGAFIVISKGSLILLVRHAYGNKDWSFPGGGVEENETFQAAALRECIEEAGCNPLCALLIAMYKSRKYEGQLTHLYHGVADASVLIRGPETQNEISEIRFVTLAEAATLLKLPAQLRFLATYKAYITKRGAATNWKPYSEFLSGEFHNKEIQQYMPLPAGL